MRDVIILAFCWNYSMPGVCIYLPAENSEAWTMHTFTKSYQCFKIVSSNFWVWNWEAGKGLHQVSHTKMSSLHAGNVSSRWSAPGWIILTGAKSSAFLCLPYHVNFLPFTQSFIHSMNTYGGPALCQALYYIWGYKQGYKVWTLPSRRVRRHKYMFSF